MNSEYLYDNEVYNNFKKHFALYYEFNSKCKIMTMEIVFFAYYLRIYTVIKNQNWI